MPKVEVVKLDTLTVDSANANLGTPRGTAALEKSLAEDGAGRSILLDNAGGIIAGNKTWEKAGEQGFQDVIVVHTTGKELVAVQRDDVGPDDPRRTMMALRDNRVGELNLAWGSNVLGAIGAEVDLSGMFTDAEIAALFEQDRDPYSRIIEAPTYEPSEYKPAIEDLYNDDRTGGLIDAIDKASGISDDEKAFLRIAAQRHTVLHFGRIADYYASSGPEMQRLMEDSALVIIDLGKAISQGYVKLTREIADMVREEYGVDGDG